MIRAFQKAFEAETIANKAGKNREGLTRSYKVQPFNINHTSPALYFIY